MSMQSSNPIGVFDSGVGGLSVWRELIRYLPNESTLYYADSSNCPYGQKTAEEIIHLSEKIVEFFLAQNVKLIVVACNTATAAAIRHLRAQYPIPFVGMEPAIKPAAVNTKLGAVGVLATSGTFSGRHFIETSQKFASNVRVEIQVGEGFVELVENGNTHSEAAFTQVQKVVQPLVDKGIDQLVLACTHYPFLRDAIEKVIENHPIELVDPAPSVAKQTLNLLSQHQLLNLEGSMPKHKFYSSGALEILTQLVQSIDPSADSEFIYHPLELV